MKIYVTKYALTEGIQEREAEITEDGWAQEVNDKGNGFTYYPARYFSLSKDEAFLKAEEIRLKKIVSLKKQINKLEKIKF